MLSESSVEGASLFTSAFGLSEEREVLRCFAGLTAESLVESCVDAAAAGLESYLSRISMNFAFSAGASLSSLLLLLEEPSDEALSPSFSTEQGRIRVE